MLYVYTIQSYTDFSGFSVITNLVFFLFVLFQLPVPIWQVFPVSLGHSK